MNETTQGGEEGKTHRHNSRKWIYLGIKRTGMRLIEGKHCYT
tara:strand:+ start:364 stop:489 length:126 start_codon:yes stop_codon:yes gene_type:complete